MVRYALPGAAARDDAPRLKSAARCGARELPGGPDIQRGSYAARARIVSGHRATTRRRNQQMEDGFGYFPIA
jgi:hypothetical protein